MQIPSFLLRRIYVKGSLANADDGFLFKLKNPLSPVTAITIDPIKVDGTEYPLEKIKILSGDTEFAATEVSESNAVPIRVGVEITIRITGESLPGGEHTVELGLHTKEVGSLSFDFKDSI